MLKQLHGSLIGCVAFLGVTFSLSAQIVLAPATQTYCGPVSDLAAGDFNGDGTRDAVVLRDNSPAFGLLLNAGSGGLGSPTLYFAANAVLISIVAGDFDGDGDLDVAGSGDFTSGPTAPAQVGVARNNGSGSFSPPVITSMPSQGLSRALVAARLRPGNALDLVCTNSSSPGGLVQVMINNGNATFTPGPSIAANVVQAIGIGDVDNDGDNDLIFGSVSTNCTLNIHKNNGQGFFSLFSTIGAVAGGPGPYGLACADVDGDGDVDVVATRQPAVSSLPGTGGTILVFRNNGIGVFAAPTSHAAGGYIRQIVLSDLDGNGSADAVVLDSGVAGLHVLRNPGAGAFTLVASFPAGFGGITVADFDSDGDRDVLTCGYDQLSFLRNLGPGGAVGPYPGTGEDLFLLTGVNDTPTTGIGQTIKFARAGNTLGVRLASPAGMFVNRPFLIGGELFPTGNPPLSPPGLPMLHLGGAGIFILADGTAGPFSFGVPAAGFQLPLLVPTGLTGQSVMLQAVAFSPSAVNAFFAATDAHEVRFVP